MPDVIKTMQVLAAALVLGILGFAAVLVMMALSEQQAQQPELLPVLGPAVVAAWIGGFVAQALVWNSQRRAVQREWQEGRLDEAGVLARYQQLIIIRYALLEGGALFGLVTVLLTGAWLPAAAAGASLLVMGGMFPTKGRWEDFLEGAKRGG